MRICDICQKGSRKIAFSRHKKGASGGGGVWKLRAPISKRIQRPNLHKFYGTWLCTKCLRAAKAATQSKPQPVTVAGFMGKSG